MVSPRFREVKGMSYWLHRIDKNNQLTGKNESQATAKASNQHSGAVQPHKALYMLRRAEPDSLSIWIANGLRKKASLTVVVKNNSFY